MKKIILSIAVLVSVMSASCLRHDIKEAMKNAYENNTGSPFWDNVLFNVGKQDNVTDTLNLGRYDFSEVEIVGNASVVFSESVDRVLVNRANVLVQYKLFFDPSNKNRLVIQDNSNHNATIFIPANNNLEVIDLRDNADCVVQVERKDSRPLKIFMSGNSVLQAHINAPNVSIDAADESVISLAGHVDKMSLKMDNNAGMDASGLNVTDLAVELSDMSEAVVSCNKISGSLKDSTDLTTYGQSIDGSQLKVSKESEWSHKTYIEYEE